MNASRPTVLIVTKSWEPTADRIIRLLTNAKVDWARFNTDQLPATSHLIVDPLNPSSTRLVSGSTGRSVNIDQVRTTWAWKTGEWAFPPSMSPEHRRLAEGSFSAAMRHLFVALEETSLVVSPIHRILAAGDKLTQLRRAKTLGFSVPPTLVTNAADQVREFVARHHEVVFKTLVSPLLRDGESVLYTSVLGKAELEHIDSVQLCPSIFQARVPRRHELRVTVVGADVFAAEIHPSEETPETLDARRFWNAPGSVSYRASTLSPDLAAQCIALVRSFGLAYAALDLIVTPAGETVFLEINPVGMYGWIEDQTGLRISEALAAMLARGSF